MDTLFGDLQNVSVMHSHSPAQDWLVVTLCMDRICVESNPRTTIHHKIRESRLSLDNMV